MKNLKNLRQEKGISQQKLADALMLTQQSINSYENRNIEPDLATLIKIADFFETSVDYLIGNTSVRHKLEPVTAYDLNEDEMRIIEKYRRLDAKYRSSIASLLDDFLSK